MASMANSVEQQQDRPASLPAEMAILGAMLVDPASFYQVSGVLTTTDFAWDSHRRIYGAMLGLAEEGEGIDLTTVSVALRASSELDSVGGQPYLMSLTENLSRRLNIDTYIRTVRNKARLRGLMLAAERMYGDAGAADGKAEEVFARWQMDMLELAGESTSGQAEEIGSIIPRVLQEIGEQREFSHTDAALWYTTGIRDLDLKMKGLYPNEYTILLGETGGAKTAWATQISVENGFGGIRSHWFSQEMTKEQLTRRMLVYASKQAKAKDVRDPRFLNLMDYTELQQTGSGMMGLPITIDDTRALPLDKLLARAKVAIHRDGAKIIVVDYIQLVKTASGARYQTDTERVDATTIALRDLAADSKKMGVHVVALSQYARPLDGKGGGAKNSRAKGSSSLEQSCQNMLHIVREQEENGEYSDEGEIIIGKCREGKLGRVPFHFDGDHLRFMAAERGAA